MCVYGISVTFADLIMSHRPWKNYHGFDWESEELSNHCPSSLIYWIHPLKVIYQIVSTDFLTFTTSAPDLNNALFYLFIHTTPHFTLHLSQFLLLKLGILSLSLSEIVRHYLIQNKLNVYLLNINISPITHHVNILLSSYLCSFLLFLGVSNCYLNLCFSIITGYFNWYVLG